MKKDGLNVLRLTAPTKLAALALVIALVLSGCGFAAKNLAKQVSDLTKQAAKIEKQASELQVKAVDIEEKAAALSPKDRRTYQEELARLGFEAPEWLFSDAEALASGAPEETEEAPGGILGLIARIFGGGNSGRGNRSGGSSSLPAVGEGGGIDNRLVGPWYVDRAHTSLAYEFTAYGAFMLGGESEAFRYSVSGDTITLDLAGGMMTATAAYRLNSNGNNLTLSNLSDYFPGAAATYYKGPVDGGPFTLTGIPSRYNGKYAMAMIQNDRQTIAVTGAQAITVSAVGDVGITFAQIRGGRAALNLWTSSSTSAVFPYRGSDTLEVTVVIADVATYRELEDVEDGEGVLIAFENVSFKNGSASRAWRDGTVEEASSSGESARGGETSWKWTAVADNRSGFSNIYAIAYGNNRWVAGGISGKMAYSTDNGVSWTAVADSTIWEYQVGRNTSMANIEAIAWGNNRFVAVGALGRIAYSADGVTWRAVADSSIWEYTNNRGLTAWASINGIAWGNNRFVAVGSQGKMAYSADGISWTAVADSTFGTNGINAIAYGNNRFIAVGSQGKMAYSSDGGANAVGESWTAVADSAFGTTVITAIAYGGNRWIIGGRSGRTAYSADGRSWTAVDASSIFGTSTGEYADIRSIAYGMNAEGNNRFVAAGYNGKMAHSSNGASWMEIANSGLSRQIGAVAYASGRFVAGDGFGDIAYVDW
jgi:hypothetical protein